MAICPKCNVEISFLKLRETRLYESDFTCLNGVAEEKNVKIELTTKFYCPNCNRELFDITQQKEAEAFLMGG